MIKAATIWHNKITKIRTLACIKHIIGRGSLIQIWFLTLHLKSKQIELPTTTLHTVENCNALSFIITLLPVST
jgi:hypothetical protein